MIAGVGSAAAKNAANWPVAQDSNDDLNATKNRKGTQE